jgi:4-hydroxy-tetrahydrodipicolinate reductase
MKIGIIGCAGRMGRMLVRQVAETEGCELAGGSEAPGHPALGADVAATAGLEAAGLVIGDDAAAVLAGCDVGIEFSLPGPTTEHAELAAGMDARLVVGTTGFDDDQELRFQKAASAAAIVRASNFSAGVNVLFALSKRLAATLDDEVAARGRDGITGERRRGDIGFAALRGGDVVGEHSVVFAGDGERVELTHKAASRVIFAAGAVRAARWLVDKPPGLYSMFDVLGFDD